MLIYDFLLKFIEGYLFSDLDNMKKIKLKSPKTEGACGYPMVSVLLSSCELLGGILSNKKYSKNDGRNYFADYWNNYLGEIDPKYKIANLAELVYNLVRHGINHTFVAKEGILVNKFQEHTHLVIDSANNQLSIDATAFYKDFKQAYTQKVKPLLITSTKKIMQQRLNEMASEYILDSKLYFDKIPVQPPLTFAIASNASTATFTGSIFSGTIFKP